MSILFRNAYNLKRKLTSGLCYRNCPLLITKCNIASMKYLNVAEKNDAAKNIAQHLSRGTSRRREGLSQYNKIYEFEAEVMGQQCQMVMTSVSGHLLALEFVGAYKGWQSCNPLSLFDAPVFKYCPENYEKIKIMDDFYSPTTRLGANEFIFKIRPFPVATPGDISTGGKWEILKMKSDTPSVGALTGMATGNDSISLQLSVDTSIRKTLEREVRGCQGLIIWTDCDREGENIGFEIIQVCTAVKSNLQVFRAKFSEITSVSVSRALRNLEQPNKNISDAVDVRQELDLRIGAAFTRFQTLRLQKVFPSKLAESLVSYGSCQFPTLGFVVERYRAVENFVSEPFWKIKVNHTMNNLSVDFVWERVRLFDRDACQVLHDICSENPLAKVCEVKTKPKSKWRPLPLDTVELEKSASRKLKINAKETMRLAEKLYTQGFISYPRTETNEFPKEMNLAQLVALQTGDANWGAFAQNILDTGGPAPRQGNKTDKAHPPIHPTKYTNSLTGNEQRLYEFIVRSFLACCSKDAQGQETIVAADIAGERFTASGLMITARNYLDVYPYDKWSSKEIHVYENGQTFDPTSIDMIDGSTSPPNLLTEADLIALMEKHGIGTDATHAEHIETIKNRSYVALADAIHFVPGLLGMGLVEGYDAMGLNISKPHLRAQLEADLKAISEGRKQPQLVLAEQVAKYKEVYQTVALEARKIDAALAGRFSEPPNEYVPTTENMPADMPAALKCPKCGADMVVRQKRSNTDEFYISCVSFPNCKNAVWLPSIVKTIQVLPETCSVCGPNYKKLKFEWRNNSISHLYPPPYITCIGGCDTTFLELLRINLSSVRTTENRTLTSTSRPNSTNSRLNSTNSRPNSTNNRPNTTNSRPNTTNNSPNTQSTVTMMPARQNQRPNTQPRQFAPPPTVNRAQTSNTTRMPDPGNANPDDNNVHCGCNQPAILLTVRKQNANFGKKFYKCPTGKDNGGCDFFLWAPESTESTAQNPYDTPPTSSWGNSAPSSNTTSMRGWGIAPSHSRDSGGGNDEDVMCNCGQPCKKITVHKEGPNKGRPFYACAKEFNQRCNFFQWADSDTSNDWGTNNSSNVPSSRGRGRGRGGGGGGGRGGGGAAGGNTRKCSLCRQQGHTRNRCPNLQND